MVFNTALSGIQAASTDLDVIGNNIANSATVGFKGSRAEFEDIYTYSSYGTGNNSVGGGVALSRIHQIFSSGQLSPTNNTLDLGIKGNGFFVVSDQGSKAYTRAGQFKLDDSNYITNGSNQRLTGFLADAAGNITGATGDILINQSNITPKATTKVTAGLNLGASEQAKNLDWVGGPTPSTDTYNDAPESTIYDSLGNSHVLKMFFIHADAAANPGDPNVSSPANTQNQWYVAFQIDNQDVPSLVGTANSSNLFRANFNTDGSFAGVTDTTDTPLANNLIPLSLDLLNGSAILNLNVDFSNCTQFGSAYAVNGIPNDGYTTGTLSGLSIDDTGRILGRYSNGKSLAMGQVMLATFPDPESLQNLGKTSWSETISSGQPVLGAPGTGGMGFIKSGMVEDSNVDLTSELVNLISAQRNFQANAQTIRTGDAITQTIINIR